MENRLSEQQKEQVKWVVYVVLAAILMFIVAVTIKLWIFPSNEINIP